MKKSLISLFALLALSLLLNAQDARQRTTQTVVVDVLAAMPAQDAASLQSNMSDLAATAPRSVELLGTMLEPASARKNSRVEYAISGVVSFVTANPAGKDAVREGLEAALQVQSDPDAKAFLQSQLRLLGGAPEAAEVLPATVLPAGDVLKAIRSKDRSTRVRALNAAPTDDVFAAKLVKAAKPKDAVADILYWLGENGIASQMPYILKNFDGAFASDAIRAAGTIGGSDAATALCSLLSGPLAQEAAAALKYCKGNIAPALEAAAAVADPATLGNILEVASSRHITSLKSYAVESGNYPVLKGLVCGSDALQMADLLDKASAKDVAALKDAYQKAVGYSADSFSDVIDVIAGASHPERFYAALASTGTDEAVAYLTDRYNQGCAALSAISGMDNINSAAVLLNASASNEKYIPQFVKLVSGSKMGNLEKARNFTAAMKYAKSADIRKKVLGAMSSIAIPEMLSEVDKYLDDPDVKREAALAAGKIIAGCPTIIDNSELHRIGGRAGDVLIKTGNADDAYAQVALQKVIDSQKIYPVSELTDEEKALGFEMLYDGTGLDKWLPGSAGYQSVNGVINVTAGYGGQGNLYTVGEYKDFIYRFEFCFLEGGVNNGVGVRTPANGCDAAYHAMCEVQILDHDDPIYAGLNDYQVHGSAYGIIPAKRLKHKPVGEWSCEEIEVRGTHIKVTVNGEVILDGDLREACRGHNVAPDGSNSNPYTVDHHNHPGMFIEKGHISFCGHGNGLQFRNIRILDLNK